MTHIGSLLLQIHRFIIIIGTGAEKRKRRRKRSNNDREYGRLMSMEDNTAVH